METPTNPKHGLPTSRLEASVASAPQPQPQRWQRGLHMKAFWLTIATLGIAACSSVPRNSELPTAEEGGRFDRRIGFENIRSGVTGRKEWAQEADATAPGFICVRNSGTVWIYKHPPHTGSGHGDGVASFVLKGRVVNVQGQPVVGCRIVELPTRQFGGVSEETTQDTTDSEGKFSFKTSVGAAITSTGEYAGDIYQSRLKTFDIRADDYQDISVSVGLQCPELLIQVRAANK